MKMEQISIHNLLTSYVMQHYANTDVLVIYQNDIESQEEYKTLLGDLDNMGFLPPKNYLRLGFLFIEMPYILAKNLINDHNKGAVRMELFSNGICIHETR